MSEAERRQIIVMGRKIGTATGTEDHETKKQTTFFNFIPYQGFHLPKNDVVFDFQTGLWCEIYPSGRRGPFYDICNTLALHECCEE